MKKKKGKINKKRLFILVFAVVLFIFLISRVFIGIKGYIESRNHVNNQINTQDNVEKEQKHIVNVVIDPAKGGINQGLATPDGSMKEKDISLDLAKRVKAELEKNDDVKVWLTREYDDNLDLKTRVAEIEKHKADILVSIRLNAQSKSNEAEGMDTYYADLGSTKKLNTEEKSSIKPKDDDSDIKSLDSTDTEKSKSDEKKQEKIRLEKAKERDKLCKKLAESIQSTTLSFVDFKDRGISKKNFDIIKYTDMPSVIVQCGFISNESDGTKLQSEDSRQNIADGISDGILNYIDSNKENILKDRINYR